MMISSIDPTRSSLSLNTGCPRIWRLALQPKETSRISATLTPRRVEPATCACEMVGAVSAMLARIKMCIDFIATLHSSGDRPSPEDRPQSESEAAAGDVYTLSASADDFGPSG